MRLFLTHHKLLVPILTGLLLAACGGTEENAAVPDPESAGTEPRQDSLVIELAGADSSTVFDLLLGAHQVDYRESLTGTFVTGIDSISVGDGFFWVFSVNDSMGQVACDNYVTRNGDRVKWHFRDMSR